MIHLNRSSIPIDILEEIITLGEGYKTEFKTTLPTAVEAAQSLCAFSNARGGNLFIGISSPGRPVGVHDTYSEILKIEESLALIIPKPEISVEKVTFKNSEIILIEVKEGNNKPYYVTTGKQTQAYIRIGDENITATKKNLKTFINRKSGAFPAVKTLKQDEKILLDFFDKEKRLALSRISVQLHYSERRIKKRINTLIKLGFIVPSLSDKDVFYRTDQTRR